MSPTSSRVAVLLGWLVAGATPCLSALNDRLGPPLDHPAILYRTGPLTDPVSVLIEKLQRGSLRLQFEGPQGYLRSLLQGLNVPTESQIAVFSKNQPAGESDRAA